MKRVLCTFLMLACFESYFLVIALENDYRMGGCYVRPPADKKRFAQNQEWSCGKDLDKQLDGLLKHPENITDKILLGIKSSFESLGVAIQQLREKAPAQAASLTNVYSGITSKLRNLYNSNQKQFAEVVNSIKEGRDKTSLKEMLKTIGINVDK